MNGKVTMRSEIARYSEKYPMRALLVKLLVGAMFMWGASCGDVKTNIPQQGDIPHVGSGHVQPSDNSCAQNPNQVGCPSVPVR